MSIVVYCTCTATCYAKHMIIYGTTILNYTWDQWRSHNFFLLRQGTTVSCQARAERGNLLLGIVTLLTSGTESDSWRFALFFAGRVMSSRFSPRVRVLRMATPP